MSGFDIESLLSQVSSEAPCGEDISYDRAYIALENLLQPRQQTALGQGEGPQEPKWSDVLKEAAELLKRSKDLRVALYVTLALLKLHGIVGLRDGLFLMRSLLERYWDCLYPPLDPDDKDGHVERMNVLLALAPRSVSAKDPMKFRQHILAVPLCSSPRLGRFSARDIQIAKGQIAVSDAEAAKAPQMSKIDAAFRDTPQEQFRTTWQGIREAIDHAVAIGRVCAERNVGGEAPDLSPLVKLLNSLGGFLQPYFDAGDVVLAGQAREQNINQKAGASIGTTLPAGQEIRSREDVIAVLGRICDYFARNEPSSPVPLLLRRAQRLISKNFLEVIADVCPDAMKQVEMIGGVSSRGESSYEASQAAK